MHFKSCAISAGILTGILASVAANAQARPWFWSNGSKCQISEHSPAYELARTRRLGGRIVLEKGGRTEVVLPTLDAYKSFMNKGFHFIFFSDAQACARYVQEQARIQEDERRERQEYEKELQKYR